LNESIAVSLIILAWDTVYKLLSLKWFSPSTLLHVRSLPLIHTDVHPDIISSTPTPAQP